MTIIHNQRLTKVERLNRPAEFKALFHSAAKIVTPGFVLLFKKNDYSYTRLGIIVAKKNFRTAVMRNRLKRLLREDFRLHKTGFPSIDAIIICRQNLSRFTRVEARADLSQLWQKVTAACAG